MLIFVFIYLFCLIMSKLYFPDNSINSVLSSEYVVFKICNKKREGVFYM